MISHNRPVSQVIRICPNGEFLIALIIALIMDYSQGTIGFNTKMVQILDDLRVPPWVGNLQIATFSSPGLAGSISFFRLPSPSRCKECEEAIPKSCLIQGASVEMWKTEKLLWLGIALHPRAPASTVEGFWIFGLLGSQWTQQLLGNSRRLGYSKPFTPLAWNLWW